MGSGLLSYHGDVAIKEKYVNRLKEHRRLEHLVRGIGWENDGTEVHGCAVGCTLESYNHDLYPIEIGLPVWLAHLHDRIFEGLRPGVANKFAVDLLEAIPVGVDIDHVKWQLAIARHNKSLALLNGNTQEYAALCRTAIHQVIDYCKLELSGDDPAARSAAWSAAESARSAAESAARSARSAARSAAESAARSARSAAWSAAESAWSAAWSAAESAWSAAWSARSAAESAEQEHYAWEAETLINLLKSCK